MNNEENQAKLSGTDTNEGSELSADEKVKQQNAAAERLEKATAEARKYGVAEAGEKPQKKEETPQEYVKRLEEEQKP